MTLMFAMSNQLMTIAGYSSSDAAASVQSGAVGGTHQPSCIPNMAISYSLANHHDSPISDMIMHDA